VGATNFVTGYTEEQIVGGSLTGDLGKWGGQLPWAKNPIGVSAGGEWRAEYIEFAADHENLSNDVYGGVQTLNELPRSGFSVTEFFGETRIPIVQGQPFFEDLTANAGYRYSSYSSSAGHTTAYKYGVEWQPIDDFRLRASFQRAVRAPNVVESFTPLGIV